MGEEGMISRHEKIVVVEDTDLVRSYIVRHLERSGFAVVGAADGVEGVGAIRAGDPDLVLCDLRMPNLDGLDLLRLLRQEFPDLPVIVMSGEGLLDDAISALKLGAWDYICKPIESAVLDHAISRALEKSALIQENRRYRDSLELLNRELKSTLRLLAEDEDAGREIQFRMLPRNHQRFGQYLFTRCVVPSTFLSGDFIDAFCIDDTRWGFYLADVSGHGVSSALVTVLLRTFVQRQVASFARTGDDLVLSPARLLARLNDEMARDDLDKHVTMFYGIVDTREHVMLWANAGHFPWPVVHQNDHTMVLEHPGVPVGMVPGSQYEEYRLPLATRMSLSVFSDGVLEVLPQRNLDEKLLFLRDFFGRHDVTIEQARRELSLTDGLTLPDDVALLIIQCGGDDANDARN
jgi:serine phosphatase RsbU (regulator of sigma subunit)